MYFTRSSIASALPGMAAATTHEMMGMASSATAMAASASIMASESMMASAAASAMPAMSSGAAMASAGSVATHVIQVGGANGTLVYSPENIQAQPGDLVQFQFNPKNHSVVQSTFDQPCTPIQNIMPNKTDAFFSGFMPSNATAVAAGEVLTYTIRVMDAKPIWFYCSQAMHCQSGMVGAINAPATGNKTMAAFKQLAGAATENLSPGQQAGSGNQAQSPAASSGGAGGAGATQTGAAGGAGGATGSSAANPAQQTTAAAGHITASLFGLTLSALAAFMLL